MLLMLLALACGDRDQAGVNAELASLVLQGAATTLGSSDGGADDARPLRAGLLSPPEGYVAGEGVAPVLVGPQGPQTDVEQAVVVFDRPMVALSGLDGATPPLSCGPNVEGRARWAGTSTAVWLPTSGAFPNASEVVCTVPAGVAAVDGSTLSKELTFRFTTERPAFKRSDPSEGSDALAPDAPVTLLFNQPVDPAVIQAGLVVRPERGAALAVKVSAVSKKDDDPRRLPEDLRRAVEVRAPFQKDTAYTFTLPAGLRGAEGTLGLASETVIKLRTIPPPKVTVEGPTGDAVDPYSAIRLSLATSTDGEEINKRLTITPAPPDGFRPAEGYTSQSWYHGLRLAPMTTYTVTVAAGITDTYGQTTTAPTSWTFTTGHYEPMVHAPQGTQVYPANNPPELPLRSRNLRTLYAKVTRLRVADLVGPAASGYADPVGGAPFNEATQIALFTDRALDDAVHIDTLDLRPYLADGKGLLRVEVWSPDYKGWNDEPYVHTSTLQVTDLGATVKLGPNGATVWATSLSTGAPEAGASLALFTGGDKGVKLFEQGASAEALIDARFELPPEWSRWSEGLFAVVKSQAGALTVVSLDNDDVSLWRYGVNYDQPNQAAELRLFSFADRGVYRPGEAAHVAFSARLASATGLSLPDAGEYTWACSDVRGADYAKGEGKLNAGMGAFDLNLPQEMPLGGGGCRVEVTADGQERSAYIDVPVYAYRAPEFRVDVAGPESLIAGDTLRLNGQARTLFGSPLKGAKAKYTVVSMTTEPTIPGFEEYRFGASEARAFWQGGYDATETLRSGEGVLNDDGSLAIELTIPPTEAPRTRRLEAEVVVTDISRQRVANRREVIVHPADVYLGLRPRSSLGVAGEETSVSLVAVTPEGKPQDGVPVEVQIARRTWDTVRQKDMDGRWTWVSTPKDEVVDLQTVSSDDDPVVVSFTPPSGGYYVVTAKARDASGRQAISEDGLYVAGAGASWARGESNQVELVADKKEYTPGDVASVLIKAPKPGLHALVTVEREGVLTRKVIKLTESAESVQIPLGEDAVPNVYVGVVLVDGAPPVVDPRGGVPEAFFGYTQLKVSPAGRKVEVEVLSDSEVYQPGDTVKVKVKARRGGAAAADAQVVLYAVDYGVLSLTGYTVPNPFDTFYALHPLRVAVADSRTRVLSRAEYLVKGANPGGGGADPNLVRKNFITTPYWNADLRTGKDGEVDVSFRLPDNLTTFQLMAVVHHGADGFGADDAQLRVSRPLIARPALPRVLRVGDRAMAGIVVHNNRDEAREVVVTAEATGLTLKGSPVTVTVPAMGAVEVPFALLDPVVGTASFTFTVDSGRDKDAVVHTIPVLRPVPADVVSTTGVVRAGQVTEQVTRPAGALAEVGGLDVLVSSTVLVGTDTALDYLVDYPHGCLEQTTSKLFALLLAKELGAKVGSRYTPAQLDERVQAGLARLRTFEHPQGGYTYWAGSRERSPLATAYALEVLQRAGQPVKDDAVTLLREFLSGKHVPTWWSREMTRSAQSRVALSLARLGKGDAGFNAGLYKDSAMLSTEATAELLETISRTSGKDKRADELLRRLEGRLFVEADAAVLREPDQSRSAALWGGDQAPSAAGLSAILVAFPEHVLAERLARGLVNSRKGQAWSNTYTTARAFAALADFVRLREKDAPGKATVSLAGASLLQHTFGPTALSARAMVPMGQLKDGPLTIGADGLLYYEARLSYALAEMPPEDAGFTVKRTMRLLEGDGAAKAVTPGALVEVTLTVTTPIDRFNVAVVDPLPAGLEAENTVFKTTASAYGDEAEDSGYSAWWDSGGESDAPLQWSSWVFNHRELRDDAVALYADWMPAGVHVYTYLARATTPGDYSYPAALAEDMYRPHLFGRTEAGRFVVGQAPLAQASTPAP
ncbi:MAG: Ig-like domain-containing protein [Deltaproteobacteria bacterium]|nr:Ig-like domain-containing protein [Deltaproteobacteria bacterium]